jgi:hypothetical protein
MDRARVVFDIGRCKERGKEADFRRAKDIRETILTSKAECEHDYRIAIIRICGGIQLGPFRLFNYISNMYQLRSPIASASSYPASRARFSSLLEQSTSINGKVPCTDERYALLRN